MAETRFRILNAGELEQLYHEHMERDFPANELKPLKWILRLTEEGYYEPYGFYRGEELIAYALFWGVGDDPYVMLDYFAVTPSERDRGVGGALVKAMTELFNKRGLGIFGEAEAPVSGDAETDALRRRRLAFYERSGMKPRGYVSRIFGVPYIVVSSGPEASDEAMMDIQRRIYHSVLDDKLYAQQVFIPEEQA